MGEARDRKEALEFIQEKKSDLLVSDIFMLELYGLQHLYHRFDSGCRLFWNHRNVVPFFEKLVK